MTFWSPADGNLSKFVEGVEKSLRSVTGLIGIPKHHCLNSSARVNVEHFNYKTRFILQCWSSGLLWSFETGVDESS